MHAEEVAVSDPKAAHVKAGKGRTPAQNRAEKEQRIRDDRTHGALVPDGNECLGWCQALAEIARRGGGTRS